jgi:hypothetical protein
MDRAVADRRNPGGKAMQLHLRCFEIWTQERSSLLRER